MLAPTRTIALGLLAFALCCVQRAAAVVQDWQLIDTSNSNELVGTWSSGSHQVLTGLGFFWPANRTFTPPPARGISYSFSADGFWEQSMYLAQPNPRKPQCVGSQLIWQHGTYEVLSNGTLILTPFWHEGAQLVSSSCSGGNTTELAYNEREIWATAEVWYEQVMGVPVKSLRLTDPWGNRRTNMNLVYRPPQMLPTEKLYVSVYGL
ncbi:uncharacterized protein PFL1_02155 [Pseudozyma flocculosa PF-1]|uniref:uncharacterized protein n=1 Tax=Pseudozyma flocculosa PF-1 TaxID=1277687 RepID=UPI0004560802|nr:uncharacterized protein PFL1_02155 [Pseudozyma flocculosa PF-1]EPQ30038.1 hypothetical protein PFL1_02155 [Pseudozyma flocculosa PF-1]